MGNSYLQGKSLRRQTVFNINHRRFCDNHPGSYSWTVLRVDTRYCLTVYHQGGVELMRDPKGDGWLIKYLGERRRVRLHISELTANLDCFKRTIEAELSKQFTALAA